MVELLRKARLALRPRRTESTPESTEIADPAAEAEGKVGREDAFLPRAQLPEASARYRGMFAFSGTRIVATFPTGASPNLRSIDCPWDTDPGPAIATISSHGLGIEINLPEVDHAFSGTMKLNYKRDIPDEVLQELPATSVKYRLEPMFVYRAAGVRPRV